MAEQHDESPSRIIPVAILTLTALVIAAVPMRTWTGKRRKLSHPAPAEHPLPVPLPLSAHKEESAPEPEPEEKHGAGAGARGKRTKERRRRDNKARAARIPASVQALLDQPLPPPAPTAGEAPADGPEPETPMAALAIDVPLPPDSDEDSLFGFGGTESVASTNATSIPTPLSLAASEVLPPESDDWAQCTPPPPPTVPSLDPAVLSGLRKELARARMDEAEQRSAAELALKECGRMADRCELLESELGEWKRRESEAQSQIQQLLHQLRAQPQPMPIPMPMHYQYFPPGAPVPVLHPLHMPPPQHQQQRAPYTPQSPMFLSPVFAPHPPPAPQQQAQYPRTPSPYERERDVAEAILRRPDAVLADA